jgi:hypothetical protein
VEIAAATSRPAIHRSSRFIDPNIRSIFGGLSSPFNHLLAALIETSGSATAPTSNLGLTTNVRKGVGDFRKGFCRILFSSGPNQRCQGAIQQFVAQDDPPPCCPARSCPAMKPDPVRNCHLTVVCSVDSVLMAPAAGYVARHVLGFSWDPGGRFVWRRCHRIAVGD